MKLKINFAVNDNPAGFNNLRSFGNPVTSTTGQVIAALTDFDTSTSTNISLYINTAFNSTDFNSGYATAQQWGLPLEVWQGSWRGKPDIAQPQIEIGRGSDLVVGNTYKVTFGTHVGGTAVGTLYTINNSETVTHVSSGVVDTPSEPVSVNAVAVDDGAGNGTLVIDLDLDPNDAGAFTTTFISFVIIEDVSATGPTITDINTNNEYTPGAANTLNGTNLSTTGGSISIDGVAQTITNRTATAITFTGVRGGNPYNQNLTLTYTDASSNTATQTVQQVPAVGFAVTAANPNTTDDASLWTGLVDTSTGDPVTVVDGDQALVKSGPAGVAVEPDGTITADETGNLVVQFWRLSEGVWGSDQTVSFEQVATEAPQFTPVIGTITKDSDSASVPFTYPGSDASSFQATTNGVDWVTVTSPISRTGLSASTAYSGQIRAVNSAGTGTAASYNFTTEALPMPSITLEGGTIYLDVGEAYIEPGFSASDPVDGDITGSVTTSTDLNTASEGTYSKTYSVTNSNGATVSETRIIIVSAVGDSWPFSKSISYAAPKTWTWGGRHPKTGMRVRIFK